MPTSDEIASRVASALGRQIQDPIKGNIQAGTSPLGGYTIPVKIEGQVETLYAKYNPVANATILAEGTRVDLKYNELGELEIVDWDRVAARASYPTPPPANLILQQHSHENGAGGGQLDASAIFNRGIVDETYGGTGQSGYTTGDLLYASSSSVLSRLPAVATGNALISGGVGAAPSYDKIGLTTHVTGTLPATNGGTGHAVYAVGDIIYASTTTALSRLADVATGNALISGGVGVAPSWGKIGLTTHVSGLLPLANGGMNADNSGLTTGALIAKTASTLSAATLTSGAVMIGGASGVPTFVSPGSDGDVLTVVAGAWASAPGGTGSSPWQTTSNVANLVTPTDSVSIGANASNGKLYVLGDDTNEVTTRIRAASGQSVDIFSIEDNSGNSFLGVTSAGALRLNADMAAGADVTIVSQAGADLIFADVSAGSVAITGSTSLNGAVVVNESGGDNDTRIESGENAHALSLHGTSGRVGVGVNPAGTNNYLTVRAPAGGTGSLRLEPGSAPSSFTPGDMYADSARNNNLSYSFGGRFHRGLWRIYAQTTTTGAANTTGVISLLTGTAIDSASMLSSIWSVGRSFKLMASGYISTDSSARNVTITVALGGTTLVSQTVSVNAPSAGRRWWIEVDVVCRSTGASGTVFSQGRGFMATVSNGADLDRLENTSTSTHNMTGTLAWTLTAQFGTANSNTEIRCTNLEIYSSA